MRLLFCLFTSSHCGYIYNNTEAPVQILMNTAHIEVPTGDQVVSQDGRTIFYGVHADVGESFIDTPNAIYQVDYPFAAKFGWRGNFGVVSCLEPGSTSNSWQRVVQFEAPRGHESNPATNCQPRDDVDCVDWLEPEKLKQMCASLLLQRKNLINPNP